MSTRPTPAPSSPRIAATARKTRLLVSVRSAEEAGIALEGGADLIDVKDPSRGPLGMAHHEAVAAVLDVVNGRVPVSAALGEYRPDVLTAAHWHLELPLTYIKWGLAGYEHTPGWGEDLLITKRQVPAHLEVVATAYADWEKAHSVPPSEVAKFARRFRYRVFLLDTFQKDGRSLLDFTPLAELRTLVESLQRGGVIVALGGSLKPEDYAKLVGIQPDYVAVRGSACTGGDRGGVLDAGRVRKWRELLGG